MGTQIIDTPQMQDGILHTQWRAVRVLQGNVGKNKIRRELVQNGPYNWTSSCNKVEDSVGFQH